MSDYISKKDVLNILYNTFDEYSMATDKQDKLGGFGAEVFKRVKEQPTLDEQEIIRKAFDRVLERLENEKERNDISCTYWDEYNWKDSMQYNEYDMSRKKSECFAESIEIIKEECGISE